MVKITKCYSPKILFFLMLIVGLFMLFLSLRIPKYSETKEYEVSTRNIITEKSAKKNIAKNYMII